MMFGMRKYVIALLLGLFAVPSMAEAGDTIRDKVKKQCKQLSVQTGKEYEAVEGTMIEKKEANVPADCFDKGCLSQSRAFSATFEDVEGNKFMQP